jgi:hypothetical protein
MSKFSHLGHEIYGKKNQDNNIGYHLLSISRVMDFPVLKYNLQQKLCTLKVYNLMV